MKTPMLLVKTARNIHVACEKTHERPRVACEKNVQAPVLGITHDIIIGLSRHPLRSLVQDRAHCCECGRVTDDLTSMSHPYNGLHQLH